MNHFVKEDFTYYERSIKAFYRKIFMQKIIWSGLLFVILVVLASLEQSFMLLSIILSLVMFWNIYLQVQKMNDFSNKFLEEQQKWATFFEKEDFEAQIKPIFESQKKYFVELMEDGQTIDIKKKDSRNLPSRKSGYTLLIGANANIFDLNHEFVTIYYDIGSLKHAEVYKEQVLKSTDFIAKKRKQALVKILLVVVGLIVAGFVLKELFNTGNRNYRAYESIIRLIM